MCSWFQFILVLILAIEFSNCELIQPRQLPLSTRGRHIVDRQGNPVRLACVSWYGFHMKDYILSGPESNSIANIAKYVADNGFNCVRLQYSLEMIQKNPRITNRTVIAADMQLFNKTALEIYDYVVKTLIRNGVMVILDNHMLDADWCCWFDDENGLWYNQRFPMPTWINYHVQMVKTYVNEPMVFAVDLRNEPRDQCLNDSCVYLSWGDGNPKTDLKLAQEQAADAIHQVNPNLLIMVESIASSVDYRPFRQFPLKLKVPNKVVLAPHSYPWHFWLRDYEQFKIDLDYLWGYLKEEYPIWVGEFGTCNWLSCLRSRDGNGLWWQYIIRYIKENNFSWGYWPLNGSKARGTGREFGTIEPFGILNRWNNETSHPVLLGDLKSIQNFNQPL